MADRNEYFVPQKPEPRVQVQPKQLLGAFGLQHLKSKFYGFSVDDNGSNKEVVGVSDFGTAIFSNIDFLPGSYTNLEGQKIEFAGLTVNTVLFSVNQSKNIVKTEIQGRNGTVKEYISDGDYDITIQGLLVSKEHDIYPEDEVKKLVEILKVQRSLEVACPYLNDRFDITDIVVETYSLPQKEGFENTQMFEINAVSDEPIELSIRTR